ncbi:hypothetical protein GOODEAATRI_010063, partial [Goodea atripinnis]
PHLFTACLCAGMMRTAERIPPAAPLSSPSTLMPHFGLKDNPTLAMCMRKPKVRRQMRWGGASLIIQRQKCAHSANITYKRRRGWSE